MDPKTDGEAIIDITAAFVAAYEGNATELTLAMSTPTTSGFVIHSSSASDPSNRPKLNVEWNISECPETPYPSVSPTKSPTALPTPAPVSHGFNQILKTFALTPSHDALVHSKGPNSSWNDQKLNANTGGLVYLRVRGERSNSRIFSFLKFDLTSDDEGFVTTYLNRGCDIRINSAQLKLTAEGEPQEAGNIDELKVWKLADTSWESINANNNPFEPQDVFVEDGQYVEQGTEDLSNYIASKYMPKDDPQMFDVRGHTRDVWTDGETLVGFALSTPSTALNQDLHSVDSASDGSAGTEDYRPKLIVEYKVRQCPLTVMPTTSPTPKPTNPPTVIPTTRPTG